MYTVNMRTKYIYSILLLLLAFGGGLSEAKAAGDEAWRRHVIIYERIEYKYEGIYASILDEFADMLDGASRDYIAQSAIYEHERLELLRRYESFHLDATLGLWWLEPWWNRRFTRVISLGRSRDLINLGPLRLTSGFRTRLKSLKFKHGGAYGHKFKISPRVIIIFRTPFIREVSCRFIARKLWRGHEAFRYEVTIGLRDLREFYVGFYISIQS